VQPSWLRRTLLDGGFEEIPIEAAHVLAVAQAEREGLLLITADALLARYPGPVRHQGSF
jgi:PIN domain nuclease of toxin-antitoxin system